jgi:carbon-monoxide dehydrogenase large subunit
MTMGVESSDADAVESEGGDLLGAPIERREDRALVTGDAEYTDDIKHPGTVHVAFRRSRYAHARIEGIDTSDAEARADVLAVYTAADVDESDAPGTLQAANPPCATAPDRPMLAGETVRYQGEPIAAVVATDRYAAHDASEAISIDYDRLDAVTDLADARVEDAPTIHEDCPTNVGIDWSVGDPAATDKAFEKASHITELDLVNNRVIPAAMEPRAAVARYRGSTGDLTVELTTQNPHNHRDRLAASLGVRPGKIRVRAPSVGGGFGSKIHQYAAETVTAWAAMELERPLKWQATRTEGFLATSHGRDHRTHAELALDDDGTILGLRADSQVGLGGYLSTAQATVASDSYGEMLCGQYDVPALHAEVTGVFTNTAPVDAYRGAGRPEACYVIERLVDRAARELAIDPTELRRRNFIPTEAFPYEVPTGHVYDSGDYGKSLDKALDTLDYDALRERREELREDGRFLGIGFSCYVEACGVAPGLFESGLVRFTPSGGVVVQAGTHSHGQGHETSYAQIAASRLGVPYDDVEVVQGDTGEVPEGSGTYGSRSGPVGGSAVSASAEKAVEQARIIAAHRFEAAAEDVEFGDGEFSIAGAPERSIGIQEIARDAYSAQDLPDDAEPGIEATTFFDPENYTFPFGTHVAVVEVDPESGEITFERYVAVDDVGERINPKIVEGQIHGGIAQGIGQALYEQAEYDDNGQLITGSLQDYVMPSAQHIPRMETAATVTPSPHNPLGVKGAGEAGTIASPPAVVNAVCDALAPFGVNHVDMPLTPEKIWRAVREAE